MIQLSKKLLTFVPSVETDWRHRGERLSFDPSENLENSKLYGKKSESCFSCSSIYTALSFMGLAHIYPCRCELISFFIQRVFQNLRTKNVKKAHTLCAYMKIIINLKHYNYEEVFFIFNFFSFMQQSSCIYRIPCRFYYLNK